jgi:hypothetical protein
MSVCDSGPAKHLNYAVTDQHKPPDLNAASLRVHAIDTIYELDLSPRQLTMLRAAAAEGVADEHKRSDAGGDEKLTTGFADFNRALLARGDDQQIAKLRNNLTELVTSDDSHLDDEVEATTGARAKAPEICREVGGPDAKKVSAVTEQVAGWLKSRQTLTDEQLVSDHDNLEASAKKLIGDVPPMDILGHWMDEETATLLSNPQLPQAIAAIMAAAEQNK